MRIYQVTHLSISGMSCGHCVRAVKEALDGVAGVQGSEVDLESGEAKVEHGPEVTTELLIAAVEAEGYRAERK